MGRRRIGHPGDAPRPQATAASSSAAINANRRLMISPSIVMVTLRNNRHQSRRSCARPGIALDMHSNTSDAVVSSCPGSRPRGSHRRLRHVRSPRAPAVSGPIRPSALVDPFCQLILTQGSADLRAVLTVDGERCARSFNARCISESVPTPAPREGRATVTVGRRRTGRSRTLPGRRRSHTRRTCRIPCRDTGSGDRREGPHRDAVGEAKAAIRRRPRHQRQGSGYGGIPMVAAERDVAEHQPEIGVLPRDEPQLVGSPVPDREELERSGPLRRV